MTNEQKELKVIDKRHNSEYTKDVVVPDKTTDIVSMALQRGYDPELIEKMMDLEERRYKEESRRAYFEALANFKSEAPKLKKDAYNRAFNSHYTSLGCLLDTYNPILAKHGLTLAHPTPEQTDTHMKGGCRLIHRMGHSETFIIRLPIDQAAIGKQSGQRSRNAIQDIKSTYTYLRSVATEGILGVAGTEGTLDDDGNAAGTDFVTEDRRVEIEKIIVEKGVDPEKFLSYMGAEDVGSILASDYGKAISALKKAKGKSNDSS